MKLQLVKDLTSQTALIFIQDSSSTTGAGLAGLAWNTASLSWFYYREAQGTGATAVTLATMTLGTWATGGFVEMDASDMPGWYEIGIPNAALATGADFVWMQLKGATNMAQLNLEIQLTGFNLATATPPVNVTQIDGLDTDGNNATLNLLALNITNSGGDGCRSLQYGLQWCGLGCLWQRFGRGNEHYRRSYRNRIVRRRGGGAHPGLV